MATEPRNATSAALPNIPEIATKYEVLGVSQLATPEELKIAYRRLAMLYHPDRQAEQDRNAAEQLFKRITAAYRTLSDPRERKRYDVSLARNEQYRESTSESSTVSLADILAEIDVYEHIFAGDYLEKMDQNLREIILKNLIAEVGEQIVGVWPMKEAPAGSTYKGSYTTGAVVLTNIRLLLPFTYSWEERSGNMRYQYRGANMPAFPLPLIDHLSIIAEGKVRPRLTVQVHRPDGVSQFRPSRSNLSKLLLIAALWGIPMESRQSDRKSDERGWALLEPWKWAIGLLLLTWGAAAVSAIFGGGFIDNPVNLTAFFARMGVWSIYILAFAALSASRIWRVVRSHGRLGLKDLFQQPAHQDQRLARVTRAC